MKFFSSFANGSFKTVRPTIAVIKKYYYRGEEYDATQEIEKVKVRMHLSDRELIVFSFSFLCVLRFVLDLLLT